jgi:hypothetical protein
MTHSTATVAWKLVTRPPLSAALVKRHRKLNARFASSDVRYTKTLGLIPAFG